MKFLPQVFPITSFGDGGFRFGSHSHLGSLMVLPSGMRAWKLGDMIKVGDFQELIIEREDLDFVLLGTGINMVRPDRDVVDFFANQNLGFEVMSTSSAVHTFNTLLAEGRRVAACLVACE